MKNLFKVNMLAVLSFSALMSCTKDSEGPVNDHLQELHFIVKTAENAPVKSYLSNNLNDTYTPKWTKGDELAIFIGTISDKTSSPTATLSNTEKTGTTAKFEGTVPTDLTDGSFFSFSPAGAFDKGYSDGTVGINLSEIQTPSSLTIDEKCDVLVAKPCDFLAENGTVAINDLYFKRIFSIVKVNLKGVEALNVEKVTSFTLSAPATLTGRAAVDLSTANISQWNTKNESVVAKYTTDNPAFGGVEGQGNTVWLVVNPITVASGSVVTFSGETENYTFSKEVTLTKDLTFPQSQIAVINLSIGEGNYTAKTTETRIFVEGFDYVSEKSTPQPSESGAVGTGVTDKLEYVYTSADVRTSGNGHSSSDYYLWNGTASAVFTINNIAISDETTLLFSCQGRTSQSNTNVTISYKESSASDWINAGSFTATTSSFDTVQKFVLSVNSSATSLDIQITNDAGNLLLDDFVLESFVDTRTTLSTPANVSASVDAETPNKVNVSWDAVENASGYEVVLSSEGKEDIVKTSSTSSLTVAGLEYSTSYSVKVKATTTDVENYIDSEYSAAVSVTTEEQGSVVEDKLVSSLFPANGTTYEDFTDVKVLSNAVYAGNSAYSYKGISLRSKNSNSGIVTTTSGGKVKSIVVEWISNTTSGRTIDVYGKNTAYSTAADLYSTTSQGTKIGTIVYGTSTELTISDNYQYIGLRSNDGALYVSSITISWDASGSSEGGSDLVKLATPSVTCTAQTETSLTFSWDAVANASGYQVSTDGGSTYGATRTETSYTWEGLTANTNKTLYVKAIGDGTSYTDSEAATASGTTTSGGSIGGETVTYTALFGSRYNSKGISSYSGSWSATNAGFTVNLVNWNNNNNGWEFIKAGSKNAASVATITTNAAISEAITKVTITIDAVTASSINSITLYCGDSANACTTSLGTFTIATGDQSVTITSPTGNKFYKISADCKKASNGALTVSKVVYTNE